MFFRTKQFSEESGPVLPFFFLQISLNTWFNGRQLESHNSFCIWSLVISFIIEPLENSIVHSEENEVVLFFFFKTDNILVLLIKLFESFFKKFILIGV